MACCSRLDRSEIQGDHVMSCGVLQVVVVQADLVQADLAMSSTKVIDLLWWPLSKLSISIL